MDPERRITLAVTGAGGTGAAGRLLRRLQEDDRVSHVDLLVSANGRRPAALEYGVGEDPESVARALGASSAKVRILDPADMSGPPTSGSHPCDAMVVLPCGGRARPDRARAGAGPDRTRRRRGAEGTPPARGDRPLPVGRHRHARTPRAHRHAVTAYPPEAGAVRPVVADRR